MERPDFFSLKNGEKVKLPFTNSEYERRVNNLRNVMEKKQNFLFLKMNTIKESPNSEMLWIKRILIWLF